MLKDQALPRKHNSNKNSSVVRLNLGKNLRNKAYLPIVLLWAVTTLLTLFGLIMVLSSSSITSYVGERGFLGGFRRQLIFTLIGIPLMVIASRISLNFWKSKAWMLFGFALFLEVLVFTPLGYAEGGNRNWIDLGIVGAQPSEFLKIALIVWMGAVLMAKEKLLHKTSHAIIPAIFPGAALAIALVLLGDDLGTALIMFAIVIGVLFFANVNWKAIALTIFTSASIAFLLLITSPNRMRRVLGMSTIGEDVTGHDWQPLHGTWALAGGGIFGTGLGGSKLKWSWLPAADNDYIFAIIGEEFGLIGATVVVFTYLILAFAMVRSIAIARDRFGKAVIGGVLVWIVGQAFFNIAVVVRLLPVIGVPLPFISSGGTALISSLIAVGVVISIANDGFAAHEEKVNKRAAARV